MKTFKTLEAFKKLIIGNLKKLYFKNFIQLKKFKSLCRLVSKKRYLS